MRTFDSFRTRDFLSLVPQDKQLASMIENLGGWIQHAVAGHTFTFRHEGVVLGIGGVLPVSKGRAFGWTVIGCEMDRPDWLYATRSIISYLDELQLEPEYTRIETTVQTDFPEAHRWAGLLGFEREGTMRCYGGPGLDHDLYARIR